VRPNVLLIVLDTARADVFEPYGADPGTTPTVAQLASRGAALPAYSTANWTVPSHASMFTGLMPRDLGLTQVAGGDRSRCRAPMADSADSNIVRALSDAGWATRGVSANPWISADSGFGVGFDELVSVVSMRRPRMHDASVKGRLQWALDGVLARADHGARQVEELLGHWIADVDADRPFFWFVNLLECHSPYMPPRPYNDLPPWRRAQVAEEARRYLNLDSVFRVCAGNMSVPAAALLRMSHLYRQAITLMDDWLARVLTAMDRARLLQDTQVIVTSDHGENLGESGLIGHAFSLDERLLRIPFVTAGPLDLAAGAPLSLAGVPRRLAGAVGLVDHPWQEQQDDVVVAQHDGVTTPDSPQMQDAARRWGLSADSVHRLSRSLTAASDTRWKLVVEHDGVEQVYDLANDPLEQRPLSTDGAPPDTVAKLRKAVDAALTGVPPAPTDAPAGPPTEETDLEALEEQMRLLGYL
jgi:arylsulfatase A-like enzyme